MFLLSTTHGAEIPALAAAIATMEVYRTEPVVEHLHREGERLAEGLRQVSARHGLTEHVLPVGRPCNLFFGTRDPHGKPSQPFRTLFLQEMIKRGVLGPSFVVSYSHSDEDVDRTIEAIDGALSVYARAMATGTTDGLPDRPTVAPRARPALITQRARAQPSVDRIAAGGEAALNVATCMTQAAEPPSVASAGPEDQGASCGCREPPELAAWVSQSVNQRS